MATAVLVLPVFSSATIPLRFKALLSLTITVLIFPWASQQGVVVPENVMLYGLVVLKEMLVGLILGFFLTLIFASFQLAAQFFSTQIGLGMSEVFDPFTQESTALLGYMFYSIAILVFLVIGGFHLVLRGIVDSYALIPSVEVIGREANFIELGVKYFSQMFYIALKIAFPVITASFIVMVGLGLIGKAAPQANILILGLPLQVGCGDRHDFISHSLYGRTLCSYL